ncbi:hypothetical protein I8752_23970 [Nostocaceae cyanobacterium CENA369]|uniref:DUF4435 domain-containing protein n=1 Tax=Dendronalium phyllosphericum CENA369 TaxID=1725256 RepID=A0A8J7I513_9NOST|nr:hypothetical protein [Dendronalium phyllosphericum]MBH8576000.1 hypothetical protein [Dendronalium phyllosphericum CENA369]
MPVDILYCEGGKDSPDIRVILNLLLGVCTTRYGGSKYGLDQKILFIRQNRLLPNSVIAGIKDGDFNEDDSVPTNTPRSWLIKDNNNNIQIGWSWERKEIENYLIDPEVVYRALGAKAPPIDQYRLALENSARVIAEYTAARIALSLSRPQKLLPLKNCWGTGRHPFPIHLAEADCRQEIQSIMQEYLQNQTIQENNIMAKFEQLLPDCRPGGRRFEYFLTFFSGKDLLCGMRSALSSFGLGEPFVFRERIVKEIQRSPDQAWTWLPEWNQLRQLVNSFIP